MSLDTEEISARFRSAGADIATRRLLVTRFTGTEQEQDLSEPANCRGLGRIRHFKETSDSGWIRNPLPIAPAKKFLGMADSGELQAQVFQNAVCNWRCWYCFVPFELLRANRQHAEMVTCGELLDLYLAQPDPPRVIDLSGGQPDLIPEWVPWMMAELRERDMEGRVYLWSDDNLSTNYVWRYLSDHERSLMASFRGYGHVGCFKGYDDKSFQFNTLAAPDLFNTQFELASRFLQLGIDTYFYATFTTTSVDALGDQMARFVDRLQNIHALLPLRLVPLEIKVFTPVVSRLKTEHSIAMTNQWHALEQWRYELQRRFTSAQMDLPITEVRLN